VGSVNQDGRHSYGLDIVQTVVDQEIAVDPRFIMAMMSLNSS
jgi:hypothetical protein